MKYKLASASWDEKEIEAIKKVIDSDNYSMGKEVKEYEKEFAAFFNTKYAVMTSSGSTANLLMIAALCNNYYSLFLEEHMDVIKDLESTLIQYILILFLYLIFLYIHKSLLL